MSKISKILILGFMVGGIFCSALVVQIAFPEAFMEKGAAQSELPIFVKEQPIEKTGRPLYAPDEIIVKFKASANKKNAESFNQRQDVVEIYESPYAHFKVFKIPKTKTVEEMVEIYKKNPNVEYAEPNFIYCAFWHPNDEFYEYQWHFDDDHTNNPGGAGSNPYGGANGGGIRMEEAWPITSGASSVIVAIIDTGVAYENYPVPSYELGTIKNGVTMYQKAPDLAGTNFVPGHDYVHNDAHANDNNSHGTHVCGTIAQSTNNAIGVAGIAYNTSIMPVKVLDQAGCGYLSDIADGINFASTNGAKVINLSLGGSSASTAIEDAVTNAYNNGVTVVASCGNSSVNSCGYPAAHNNYVIAVGATQYDETLAPYSNYGSSLDLVAPGGNTGADQNEDSFADGILQNTFTPYDDKKPYCVSPNDTKADPTDFGYWFFQGTSMSAPHVAGVAALLLAQNSSRTPDDIRIILQDTAEDKGAAGWDEYYGHGLLDAAAALTSTPIISISIENDDFDYGTLPLSASVANPVKKSTIDLNKTPVIENTGNVNVDLAVKSSDAAGGSTDWNLVSSANIGEDEFCYQYSTATGPDWYDFPISNNYTGTVFSGLGTNETTTLDLQTLMPTGSTDITQKSIIVTILATESGP